MDIRGNYFYEDHYNRYYNYHDDFDAKLKERLDIYLSPAPVPGAFKRTEKWTMEDYEILCELIQDCDKCKFTSQEKLVTKLRTLLLLTLFYGRPDLISLQTAEKSRWRCTFDWEFKLDPTAFTATSPTCLVVTLEKLLTEENIDVEECLPFLEQFNKIMKVSTDTVRKNYHRLKINIISVFLKHIRGAVYLINPKKVARTCCLCLNEMAELQDKKSQNELKPLLIPIFQRVLTIVRWYQRKPIPFDQDNIRASEEKYLMSKHLTRLLDVCIKLLKINCAEKHHAMTEKISSLEYPQLDELMAHSICSYESAWTKEGIRLIEKIEHREVLAFVKEYYDYERAFENLCQNHRTITIDGEVIPYHSSMVPEYVIDDIQKNSSITSKAVKAILYGLYCGWSEDSVLFKYWKKDWVHAVTQLHPEIAEEPSLFFKHHFSDEFDQQFQVFTQKMAGKYGPPDLYFQVEEKLIPAHREVIKSYCHLLGPSYFTGLFSDWHRQRQVVDLTHESLTHWGVSLELMHIYQKKMKLPQFNTFRSEQKCAREFFFPTTHPLVLSHKCYDTSHKDQLFNLRFQFFLKKNLTSNPSQLADILVNFYLQNYACRLVYMCEEAFRVATENKIRILGKVENLIELVQQKVYQQIDLDVIRKYSNEDQILYFRYQAERLEEKEFFDSYYGSMGRGVFSLGEKGRQLFRRRAFNSMRSLLTTDREINYREFGYFLIELNRLLSFAEVDNLTAEEISIVTTLVNTLPEKLPKLMLVGANIDLKNEIMKLWKEFNKKLGVNIPFEIDFDQ